MDIKERQIKIRNILQKSTKPVSATYLADQFGVSRVVIVKDISIMKASGDDIISTNKGYKLGSTKYKTYIIKVRHGDDQIEDELNAIVDNGAVVKDVFINHESYGIIKKDMNISSRKKVKSLKKSLEESKPLKHLTSDIHYHTISYEDDENLGRILEKLDELNILMS